jgi:hypothetical protein
MTAVLIFVVVIGIAIAAFYVLRKRQDIDAPMHRTTAPAPAAASAEGQVWLVGAGGEVDGKRYRLGEKILTIGRAPTNAIQVVDEHVSRKHCQLRPAKGGVQVTDMKSETGTFLNGVRVEVALMGKGDELRVGEAKFKLTFDAASGQDSALGKKLATAEATKSTVNSGTNVTTEVKAALEAAGGDVDKAAAALGIKAEALRGLMGFLEDKKE